MAEKPKKRTKSKTKSVRGRGHTWQLASGEGPAVGAQAGRSKGGHTRKPVGTATRGLAIEETRAPRPYTSRYPIPDSEFEALKEAAPQARLATSAITAARDSGRRKVEYSSHPATLAARQPGAAPATTPSGVANFSGIAATGWLPPDCTMAVGPDHVMVAVNSSVAIYDKAAGPALHQETLAHWFAQVVTDMTVFDPKLLYDQHAGRWVLLAVAVQEKPNASLFLLSVSASSDPLGAWHSYALDAMLDGTTPSDHWADYPGLGVDSHALYITANMFGFNGGFGYAKIRVVPKAGPYSGAAANFFDFTHMKNADGTPAFTIQPCHTFGAPQVEYLVNSLFPNGDRLTLWSITGQPNAPVLHRLEAQVSPYSLAPNAEQSGGKPPLNTGDVRVQHAVFRGDCLWTAITTAYNWGTSKNRAAIQWCQIEPATAHVVQEGVFGTSNRHYFFPAACPDDNGNMVILFDRSGPSEFGSLYFASRHATDPLGTLQASVLLKSGTAHYIGLDDGGRNRWGDYNGIAADPANSQMIWLYGGYAEAKNTWGTWIASVFF